MRNEVGRNLAITETISVNDMTEITKTEQRTPRILLVDDDREFLRSYRELLIKQECHPEVRTAENGQRALAMLDAGQFDLLVCDLKMAKVDGFQVLAIVRRKYPRLRTMVLTGLADEQMRDRKSTRLNSS